MSFETNDFWHSYQHLAKKSNETITDIRIIATVFSQLKASYVSFAESIKNIGENFHKELSTNFIDNNSDKNLTYYQYLGSYILKIAELNKQFADKIQSEVLHPYVEFGQNVKSANYETLEKLKQILLNVDYFKSSLRKQQDNYYKLSKSAEKSQENFEKAAIKGNKKEDQLQKAQDKLLKLKMEAQESGEEYRKQINNLNNCAKMLYSDFKGTFEIHQDNEDNKCVYTKNSILALIKNFNKLYSIQDNRLLEDPDERLKVMAENELSKSQFSSLYNHGNIIQIIKDQPLEEFLSYEAKKKHDDLAVVYIFV